MDNTASNGSVDVDKFQRAMLVYRNSIDPETRASPAMILFGRPIRDAIPIPMGRYCPHSTWVETLAHRERALAKRHTREHEKWSEHTRSLPALHIGDKVYIQNLVGNHPRRWERTGTVVEVREFHQYLVKVDGSGRLTLRNRQHLRRFTPFNTKQIDVESLSPATQDVQPMRPSNVVQHRDSTANTPRANQLTPPHHSPISPPPNEEDHQLMPTLIDSPSSEHLDKEVENAQEVPLEVRSDPPPSETSPPKAKATIPRAVARLLPHNAPGIKEDPPEPLGRGSRRRRN